MSVKQETRPYNFQFGHLANRNDRATSYNYTTKQDYSQNSHLHFRGLGEFQEN